jgi:hypothetical protein
MGSARRNRPDHWWRDFTQSIVSAGFTIASSLSGSNELEMNNGQQGKLQHRRVEPRCCVTDGCGAGLERLLHKLVTCVFRNRSTGQEAGELSPLCSASLAV